MYLGRKAFTPGLPVPLPVRDEPFRDGALLDVLKNFPWYARRKGDKPLMPLRYVHEASFGAGESRQDVPRSFAARTFDVRHVKVEFIDRLTDIRPWEDRSCS